MNLFRAEIIDHNTLGWLGTLKVILFVRWIWQNYWSLQQPAAIKWKIMKKKSTPFGIFLENIFSILAKWKLETKIWTKIGHWKLWRNFVQTEQQFESEFLISAKAFKLYPCDDKVMDD